MEDAQLTFKINLKRQFLAFHHLHLKKKEARKKWFQTRRKINKYLRVAKRIANFVVQPEHKTRKLFTSKEVKFLGKIPSSVACQTVYKYQKDKKCKKVSKVNLIQPACSTVKYPSVRQNQKTGLLEIVPLKLKLNWKCPVNFLKINQVQVNSEYVFVCVSVPQKEKKEYQKCVGVDLNVKHNLATIGSQEDDFFQFLGRDQIYRRTTYKEIRRRWQRQKKLAKVREMGDKEQRIMRDVNHKIANEIVRIAQKYERNIALEDLSGIRGTKTRRSFNWFLHNWAFYDLQMKIKSKAERIGIEVIMIDPAYTSQDCSECGNRKKCQGKKYKCLECGLEIHRDVNSSYNIAERGNQALLDQD